MQKEYLIYDLETFGLDTAHDRVAQFACRRYNENLEPQDDGTVLYCKLPRDYLPSPSSCILTGITPEYVNRNGYSENEFSKRVYAILNHKKCDTLILGYNNTHFDDKMLNFLFFRNFLPPYTIFTDRSIDCFTLAKAVHFAKPDIFKYRKNEFGLDSLKLEHLSKDNGFEHTHAHDALSDVEATAQVFNHIRINASSIFNAYLTSFNRSSVEQRLRFASQRFEPLFALFKQGVNKEALGTLSVPIACAYSTYYLFNLLSEDEELEKNLGGLKEVQVAMKKGSKDLNLLYPFTGTIKISSSPFLADDEFFYNAIEDSERLKVKELVESRYKKLKEVWTQGFINTTAFKDSKKTSLQGAASFNQAEKDVDELINDGFLSKEAPSAIEAIETGNVSLMLGTLNFLLSSKSTPERTKKLFTRFLARNYYDQMPEKFKSQWDRYCKSHLLSATEQTGFYKYRTLDAFNAELEACKTECGQDNQKQQILSSLEDYRDNLIKSFKN